MILDKFEIMCYIKNYKFNSIFIKNLLLLILLLVIPLSIITFVSYSTYNRILQNEIRNGNIDSIVKVRDMTDMVVKEARNQISWAVSDKNIELFMHTGAEEEVGFYSPYNLSQFMNMYLFSKNYYDSIYIFSQRSGQVISSTGRESLSTFIDNEWYDSYSKNIDISVPWIELRSKKSDGSDNSKKLISIFKNVNYGPESKGVIIFNLDAEKLGDQLISPSESQKEIISVLDENNDIIFCNNKSFQNFEDTGLSLYMKDMDNNSVNVVNKNNSKEIVSYVSSVEGGWRFISMVPFDVFEEKVGGIRNIMLMLVLFSLIFTFFISFIISAKTFNPIKRIISIINQPESLISGDIKNSIKEGELKYIVESLTRSINNEKTISEELQKRIELLKKSQAIALQSQINPHFFHNTLETINWMAMKLTGGKNEVSRMITSLSYMLRLSLESTDKLIPFYLEMEHACKYIEIQRIRYDGKFDVMWNIPDEISRYKVIKITLQPIIENAIYHGIKQINGIGMITITGYIENNNFYIEIKDNGKGMSEEELEAINGQMKNEYIRENEHLGLMNVNQRLKLFFGEDYGIHVESSQNIGTTVRISMPVIM